MSTETTNTSEEPIPAPVIAADAEFPGIPLPEKPETPTLTEMTPDEDIPAIKLGDMYDHCLLGATVKGRYAYSIKEIVKFEMMNRRIQIDEAEKVVMADIVDLMRQYGAAAPEFIDDSLLDAKIEIIMPQR